MYRIEPGIVICIVQDDTNWCMSGILTVMVTKCQLHNFFFWNKQLIVHQKYEDVVLIINYNVAC